MHIIHSSRPRAGPILLLISGTGEHGLHTSGDYTADKPNGDERENIPALD
jgi:hypothetical protein